MNIKGRLRRAEEFSPVESMKQHLILSQDQVDPNLFHGQKTTYQREDLDQLREKYQLIIAMHPEHKEWA